MNFFARIRERFKRGSQEQTDRITQATQTNRFSFIKRFREIQQRHREASEEFLESLEELLISFDVSGNLVRRIVGELQRELRRYKQLLSKDVNELVAEKLYTCFSATGNNRQGLIRKEGSNVYMLVGVNGNGKTSCCAKLALYLKQQGRRVLLVAADTFRAAAQEQLIILGERIGVEVISADREGQDPASIVYTALDPTIVAQYDDIIIDTAGRLHNNVNLMHELAKIKRVIGNRIVDAPSEVLLVLDSSNGQNAINQARIFTEQLNITGVILTKLDGTSRGGFIFSIKESLDLDILFATIGENVDDLVEFNIEWYLYQLINAFDSNTEQLERE